MNLGTFGKSDRRAFTLLELLLVIGIIGILVTLLLPALKNTRKNARTLICMSNMRQLAVAQNNYANQYKELIGTFNRKPQTAVLYESSLQAQEIVKGISGKTLPAPINRYFHRNYWHLPAVSDGAFGSTTGSLISPVVACPEDRTVLEWKKNSNNPAALLIGMASDGAPGYELYRPYWSSYQQVTAAWTSDVSVSTSKRTISQIVTSHHLYTEGGQTTEGGGQMLPVGRRTLNEVAFPSSKVWLMDLYDRHFYRRMIWHGYDVSRQPLVFFDTSVRIYKTKDARNGHVSPSTLYLNSAPWNPDTTIGGVTEYNYTPGSGWLQYDPPTLSGAATDKVKGRYRWTYKGLKGWDYLGDTAGNNAGS